MQLTTERRSGPSKTVLRLARELIAVSGSEWSAEQAERFLDQLDPSIRRYLILNMLTGAGERLSVDHSVVTRNKIQAIRLIRQYTGWGLKEAKEFVELAGGEIRQAWSPAGEITVAKLPETLGTEQLCRLSSELAGTGYQLE